jgi:hypothetical protein
MWSRADASATMCDAQGSAYPKANLQEVASTA